MCACVYALYYHKSLNSSLFASIPLKLFLLLVINRWGNDVRNRETKGVKR